MVREANENGKSEANEKEKNEQREQCGLETSLGLNSKSSRWPLHLVREANEKNEKSEKNKKNEKHLSLGHHENLDEEYLMCQTGRRPQCEFRDDKTISGCLLGSRRRHQWTQRIRTHIRLESDAAKTTTVWESSQCVYARKSLRGAPFRPPNSLFQMSQEDNLFRRPQRWVDHPDQTARKKDPGLRLTRFDSVDGNLYEVTQLDVTTRGPARTRQCDGMATTSRGMFLTLTSTTIGGGGMDNTSLQK